MKRWLPLLVLAGCFSPKFGDGNTPCTKNADCPPGLYCAADQRCWHEGRAPALDMSTASDMLPDGSEDLAHGDAGSPDLSSPPDLSTIFFPPAPLWISSGGGSSIAPASQHRLNFSVGGASAIGSSTGPATGKNLTFGYFCSDTIP